MNAMERMARSVIVPVVVLEDAKDAVPTAKAMCAGGVDVMEITFRTAAAADSIRAVAEGCPEVLVGAGTVITLEQCKTAVACGAKFIVAPGFDEEVVRWCIEHEIPVLPGCVTPTEIIVDELKAVADKYGKERRTTLVYDHETQLPDEPEVPDYPVTIFVSREGYFKKITPQSLRMSGEQKFKEGDSLLLMQETSNNQELLSAPFSRPKDARQFSPFFFARQRKSRWR